MATDRALELLDCFYNQLDSCADLAVIRSAADIVGLEKSGKIGALLTIEGGGAADSLVRLRNFYRLGVRLVTLSWNSNNTICRSIAGEGDDYGLTSYGAEVVREMNRLGMAIDVSHVSEKTFWDTSAITTRPIIASHSNAKRLCSHRRNLTDSQIEEIIRQGGFIGINLCNDFLVDDGKPNILDIIKHVDHILSLGGKDVIGLGMDLDGIDAMPQGMADVTDISRLQDALVAADYNDEIINKFMYGNLRQYLIKVL